MPGGEQAIHPAARSSTALPVASIALVVGGVVLLGWVSWFALKPDPPPYRYELVAEGEPGRFPDLQLPPRQDFSVRQYELRTDRLDEPLAIFHVGQRGNAAPVLLDWQNQFAEPLLTLDSQASEFATLAEAITKHLPAGAVILAWWDTSRRLALLTGADTLFEQNLARPIIIPAIWREQDKVVLMQEHAFWQVPDSSQEFARMDNLVEALLADEPTGVATLRELAGNGEGYLVLRLSDAYKLGIMRPDRFGIGYKDFPSTGQTHGLIGRVKNWLREQGYDSYALETKPDEQSSVRVYFLTDVTSADSLLAKLLPFSISRPFDQETLPLVYQHGDYWVYKIPPLG